MFPLLCVWGSMSTLVSSSASRWQQIHVLVHFSIHPSFRYMLSASTICWKTSPTPWCSHLQTSLVVFLGWCAVQLFLQTWCVTWHPNIPNLPFSWSRSYPLTFSQASWSKICGGSVNLKFWCWCSPLQLHPGAFLSRHIWVQDFWCAHYVVFVPVFCFQRSPLEVLSVVFLLDGAASSHTPATYFDSVWSCHSTTSVFLFQPSSMWKNNGKEK